MTDATIPDVVEAELRVAAKALQEAQVLHDAGLVGGALLENELAAAARFRDRVLALLHRSPSP